MKLGKYLWYKKTVWNIHRKKICIRLHLPFKFYKYGPFRSKDIFSVSYTVIVFLHKKKQEDIIITLDFFAVSKLI